MKNGMDPHLKLFLGVAVIAVVTVTVAGIQVCCFTDNRVALGIEAVGAEMKGGEVVSKEKSFIYFEIMELDEDEETTILAVRARGGENLLGKLTYYARWRGWVFCPEPLTIWSAGCLDEVTRKVRQLNKEAQRRRKTDG